MLETTSELLLKLGINDTLGVTSPRGSPCLMVNGEAIYYLNGFKHQLPFVVKRSVRGPVLHIPSMYKQYYRYEGNRTQRVWNESLENY